MKNKITYSVLVPEISFSDCSWEIDSCAALDPSASRSKQLSPIFQKTLQYHFSAPTAWTKMFHKRLFDPIQQNKA